jgi:hypothetical protein
LPTGRAPTLFDPITEDTVQIAMATAEDGLPVRTALPKILRKLEPSEARLFEPKLTAPQESAAGQSSPSQPKASAGDDGDGGDACGVDAGSSAEVATRF